MIIIIVIIVCLENNMITNQMLREMQLYIGIISSQTGVKKKNNGPMTRVPTFKNEYTRILNK